MTRSGQAGRGPRAHHVVFGLALGLLVALAVWWFVFLSRTIDNEERLVLDRLELQAQLHASRLGGAEAPPFGALADAPGFEVVPSGEGPGGAGAGSVMKGPAARTDARGFEIRPSAARLDEVARHRRRQRLMVLGEGSLLLLLVTVCVVMLYRLVHAESRYRRDIDEFLARVTHEMKTPLAGLRALLETLRAGRVPPERLQELAMLGLRQAEREEHLIENLLTAQRSAAGGRAPALATLELATELRAFLAHRRESMGLPVDRHRLDCPEGLRAQASAASLATILENLLDNADKQGARRIEIRARSEGERLRIEVGDDGPGFAPEDAERLFEAFRRGAPSPSRHGTGLGLSISRKLAREMGGELLAASPGPGRGASFTIVLKAAGPGAQP